MLQIVAARWYYILIAPGFVVLGWFEAQCRLASDKQLSRYFYEFL